MRARLVCGLAALIAGLSGCGSSGGGGTDPSTSTIGPGGGTLSPPGGPTLQVPAGALAAPTTITVTESSVQAPSGAITKVFKFSPEGTTFASPVTVSFAVPAGTTSASIYWTKPGSATEYDSLPTTISGTTATAQVTHFSSGFVGASCTTGASCAPSNACHQGAWTCNGTPVCADTGTAVEDGAGCGGGNVCIAGTCAPSPVVSCRSLPVVGSPPTPYCAELPRASFTAQDLAALAATCAQQAPGDAPGAFAEAPCAVADPAWGSLRGICSFTNTAAIGAPVPLGTPIKEFHYSLGETLAGAQTECDGLSGTFTLACWPGTSCAPAGSPDPCKSYATTCDGAKTTCSVAANRPDGTPCGAGQACSAGACVAVGVVPTGVTATPGNGTTTISWNPTPGATSYAVYHSTTPATAPTKVTVAGSPAVVADLANGSARYFAVASVVGGVESAPSAVTCAVPTPASIEGLTLHDASCGAVLAGRRWLGPGAFSTEVVGGEAVLGVDVADQEPFGIRAVSYQNSAAVIPGIGGRVTTIRADLRVPAATAARTGGSILRVPLRLLYSPPAFRLAFPGGNQHILQIEVGLIDVGEGLRAFRMASHCDDPSCTAVSATNLVLGDPQGFAPVSPGALQSGAPAAYDTTYRMTARLDESTGVFHWTIAGGSFGAAGVSGTIDPKPYLEATPAWSGVPLGGPGVNGGPPAFLSAQIAARTHDNSALGGGSGRVKAHFDNVDVAFNGGTAAPYDDFSGANGNSGPHLSLAKWGSGGAASVGPRDGGLVIRTEATNPGTNPAGTSRTVSIADAAVNTIQADVEVTSIALPPAGSAAAILQGRFYNDGRPPPVTILPSVNPLPNVNQPYSAVGDIVAGVYLNPISGTATYNIHRCPNAICTGQLLIGSGTVAGTLAPGRHTLLVKWDPTARTFTFGVDGQTVTVDPTVVGGGMQQAAPFAGPANAPLKAIVNTLSLPGGAPGATGLFEFKVNNVFVAP